MYRRNSHMNCTFWGIAGPPIVCEHAFRGGLFELAQQRKSTCASAHVERRTQLFFLHSDSLPEYSQGGVTAIILLVLGS
jgi:hypothetical protein